MPCKVNTFFSSNSKRKPFSRTVKQMHLQLYRLISYIFVAQSVYKRCSKLTPAYNKVHMYSMWSHTLGEWLYACKIWRSLVTFAGSRSPQRLFCTKSSTHGISVIKTRWSLTTENVNSSFYCTCIETPIILVMEVKKHIRETWIQCTQCLSWVHENCPPIGYPWYTL